MFTPFKSVHGAACCRPRAQPYLRRRTWFAGRPHPQKGGDLCGISRFSESYPGRRKMFAGRCLPRMGGLCVHLRTRNLTTQENVGQRSPPGNGGTFAVSLRAQPYHARNSGAALSPLGMGAPLRASPRASPLNAGNSCVGRPLPEWRTSAASLPSPRFTWARQLQSDRGV